MLQQLSTLDLMHGISKSSRCASVQFRSQGTGMKASLRSFFIGNIKYKHFFDGALVTDDHHFT